MKQINSIEQIVMNYQKEPIKDPKRKIFVYDVTLRDGEQASGFHMFPSEKLKFAYQLARMRVDGIEAGFAASSKGDFNAINQIAKEVGNEYNVIISSLARAKKIDIDMAARAIEPAKKKRIHTFIATSDIHTEQKLRKSKQEIMQMAVDAVIYAKKFVSDVEFSCEDFGRSDMNYIIDVASAVINAGATTINLPDTVGWMFPHEAFQNVAYVIDKVRERTGNKDVIFSVHNHNDFGMATATTCESILAGAGQVEVTMNGIGERAGNTALEEVIVAMKTRGFADFNIDIKLIGETSRMLSEITGVYPQPNKAIVGSNAFSHEAGIHQDGVQKSKITYETVDPKSVGVKSKITFGPRSGRNALRVKYESLGIKMNNYEFNQATERFMSIADEVKEIDDADVVMSVYEDKRFMTQQSFMQKGIKENPISGFYSIPITYEFVSFNPVIDKNTFGAVVEMKVNGKTVRKYNEGNGQFDAAVKAINEIIERQYEVGHNYEIKSSGEGSDAIGVTKVEIKENGYRVKGTASHSDSTTSAIQAYIVACNRMNYVETMLQRQV